MLYLTKIIRSNRWKNTESLRKRMFNELLKNIKPVLDRLYTDIPLSSRICLISSTVFPVTLDILLRGSFS